MSINTTIEVTNPKLKGFIGNHKLLDILYIVESGSNLWGLKTETSDTDFTGIYLPSVEDCILGHTKDVITGDTNPSTVNTKDDVDIKFLSLHHFVKNLAKGDSDSIAVISAPAEAVIYRSARMDLFTNRLISKFVSERAVSSALGGAKGRYETFLKTGEPKMLYHACRFLYISHEILKHRKVTLPIRPELKDLFLKIKAGDTKLGLALYHRYNELIRSTRYDLPKVSQNLINATILSFYN